MTTTQIEIASVGVDEALQGLAGDPYGGLVQTGLRIPAAFQAEPSHRYLFLLAGFTIGDGACAHIIGFRQGLTLGCAAGNEIAPRRVVEQEVTSPFFKLADANVSWHLRVLGQHEPSVPNPGSGPVQPALQNFAYESSDTPALLYQAATFPGGPNPFYTSLVTYTPPNGGMPPGAPLAPGLGTFYDLKTSWRTPGAWRSLDVWVEGPARVGFYASVKQTDIRSRIALAAPIGFYQCGLSAEEQFLLNFPNASLWRVAGALIVAV